jgi:hypothetical protein
LLRSSLAVFFLQQSFANGRAAAQLGDQSPGQNPLTRRNVIGLILLIIL